MPVPMEARAETVLSQELMKPMSWYHLGKKSDRLPCVARSNTRNSRGSGGVSLVSIEVQLRNVKPRNWTQAVALPPRLANVVSSCWIQFGNSKAYCSRRTSLISFFRDSRPISNRLITSFSTTGLLLGAEVVKTPPGLFHDALYTTPFAPFPIGDCHEMSCSSSAGMRRSECWKAGR